MSELLFERVAIIGLGQMGASLGLALKAGGLVGHVIGYDLHPDHSSTALSIEAIDALAVHEEEAAKDADLIVLCTPVGAYAPIMKAIQPSLKTGAIITDIGSIKQQAIRDIEPHLPDHVNYIPSHPIAGSEKVGPSNAREKFFHDHLFLITPAKQSEEDNIKRMIQLWQSTEAKVEVLPADLHDQIYAYMSHLPQLMAFVAAMVLDSHAIRLKDDEPYFARFIRISRSDPEMWRDVFLENSANMISSAEQSLHILQHMRDEMVLGVGDNKNESDSEATEQLAKDIWPRILASSLIASVNLYEQKLGEAVARFAAGGFTDFTCPAAREPGDAEMELVSNHAQRMIELLSAFVDEYQNIIEIIRSKDADHLLAQLAVYQACGKRLITPLH